MVASTVGQGRLFRSSLNDAQSRIETPAPSRGSHYHYTQSLAIGGNEQFVFAPDRDGQIVAYDLETMQPAARLVSRRDHAEWIAHTTSGYFTCSDDARASLYWQHGDRRYPLDKYAANTDDAASVAFVLTGERVPHPDW
jgi:hypothetical protein